MSTPEEEPPSPRGPTDPAGVEPTEASDHSRLAEARALAEHLREAAGERLEVERGRRRSVKAAFTFYERDRLFAGALLAGGLAFRIFLWLLPFGLFVVTLIGAIGESTNKTPDQIARDAGMGAAFASTVGQAVDNSSHGRYVLLVIGAVLTIWLGRSLVRALKVVCNIAWHLPPSAKASIKESFALVGAAVVFTAIPFLAGVLYAGGLVTDILAGLVLILLFGAVGLWGMTVLPRKPGVPWPWLIPGAIVIGVGAEAVRLAASLYFAGKLERSSGLYGALGVTIVFLLWLYVVGRVIVAAVNLNATIWDARNTELPAAHRVTDQLDT
jgi:uncharacterized BrkB/YihY/UPF0761 family membrane protein